MRMEIVFDGVVYHDKNDGDDSEDDFTDQI